MLDKVTVKFKIGPDQYDKEMGRWCNICKWVLHNRKRMCCSLWCRNDEEFLKLNGKRKTFHKGGNSSCHFHICQHYKVYEERCNSANIPVNHWVIPQPIWKAMEEEKAIKKRGRVSKKQSQQLLDFKLVVGPREFRRAGVLHAIVVLIVTNNQVCC